MLPSFALFMCSVYVCVYYAHGNERICFIVDGAEGGKATLYENDECNRTNGVLWTCQKLVNCPEALDRVKKGEHPFVCGFQDKEPIVCCNLAFMPDKWQVTSGSASGITGEDWSALANSAPLAVATGEDRPALVNSAPLTQATGGDRPALANSAPLTEAKSEIMCLKYNSGICYSFPAYVPPPGTFVLLGGVNSGAKEFPHMALIGYGNGPDDITWKCGGSLISENFVLSAAHCTFPGPIDGPAKYVRIGDLNTATDKDDARPQQFEIIERIDHPEYRPPMLYNDIALYRLDRNATFDDYVRPICLHQSYSLPEGAGVATGWGRLEFAGPVSKILQKANLTYIDSVQCNQLVNTSGQLPRGIDQKSMVCAGERDGSKDTCQGDSGGPLTMQKNPRSPCLALQVGITSFGRQCGLPDSPGVYTRVAHFVPWIESVVWPGFV